MDNDGAPAPGDEYDGQDPNQLGLGGAGGEDNVDQYFDDGGETFLPADHVSREDFARIGRDKGNCKYLKCNRTVFVDYSP